MANGKVRVDITMSLDGFIAGPNDDVGNGLGDGGERIHQWLYDLKSFNEIHGNEGGEEGPDSEMLAEAFHNLGAHIVGKRMFMNAEAWGDEPPFHNPVFVVTHEQREPLEKTGTTFYFVDGIEKALTQAKEAAGEKDVAIAGGANVFQQFAKAGLIDEMQIHIAPLFMGAGVRLFEGMDQSEVKILRTVESPKATHIKYSF